MVWISFEYVPKHPCVGSLVLSDVEEEGQIRDGDFPVAPWLKF